MTKRGTILIVIFAFLMFSACSKEEPPKVIIKSPVELIQESVGTTEEESQDIYNVIEKSGIILKTIVASPTHDNFSGSDSKAFSITTLNVKDILLLVSPDNTVYRIQYYSEVIYDDGSFKKPLYDAISGKYITLYEYNQIDTGMSYSYVRSIVGGDGELQSKVDLDIGKEYVTELYIWTGFEQDGSNAVITFQNGKVTSFAQIGLI